MSPIYCKTCSRWFSEDSYDEEGDCPDCSSLKRVPGWDKDWEDKNLEEKVDSDRDWETNDCMFYNI